MEQSQKQFSQAIKKQLQAQNLKKEPASINKSKHNQQINQEQHSQNGKKQTTCFQITQGKINIKKQREAQNDQSIINQHREARSKFYSYQIYQALKEHQIKQQELLSCFTAFIYLASTKIISDKISLLKHSLQQREKQFLLKEKEFLPIKEIDRCKLDCLRTIHIQYQLKINKYKHYECRYSISSFQLFKIVSYNKLLEQVTIKGVQIEKLTQFMERINPHNKDKDTKQSDYYAWMKNFKPLKSLSLSIDAKISFNLMNEFQTYSRIKDLVYFNGLFHILSSIIVNIALGRWTKLNNLRTILQYLWRSLKLIKKIKIQIQAILFQNKIYEYFIDDVRLSLFGGLATLTEITSLSFIGMSFQSRIKIKDFLAIEQTLCTIFQNNSITYLKLNSCNNFPICVEMTTLQFIDISWVSFIKKINFMEEIIAKNNDLKFLKYGGREIQEWHINNKLLNQLQTLSIINSNPNISNDSQSQSKMKHLIIQKSQIGNSDCLFALFPKLFHLTYLELHDINFEDKLLLNIPSSHLAELHIIGNNVITDRGIELIDVKWPNLRYFQIIYCQNITKNVWCLCHFKGLIKLKVQYKMLGDDKKALQYLKKIGIIVDYS